MEGKQYLHFPSMKWSERLIGLCQDLLGDVGFGCGVEGKVRYEGSEGAKALSTARDVWCEVLGGFARK